MTDRDALLAAVVAAPDDPVPRLVFADYLDEHGDPDWAELIRLQNGYFKHWTNAEEMADREAELVAVVSANHRGVPGVILGSPVRGFPERAIVFDGVTGFNPGRALAVLDSYPINWVEFRYDAPAFAVAGGWLRRVRVLEIVRYDLDPNGVSLSDVFGALDPAALRGLLWRDDERIGDAGAIRLAAAPGLAGLTELHLRGDGIGPDGCDALIASPYLTRLEYLDLAGNPVGAAARRLERRFGPALRLA